MNILDPGRPFFIKLFEFDWTVFFAFYMEKVRIQILDLWRGKRNNLNVAVRCCSIFIFHIIIEDIWRSKRKSLVNAWREYRMHVLLWYIDGIMRNNAILFLVSCFTVFNASVVKRFTINLRDARRFSLYPSRAPVLRDLCVVLSEYMKSCTIRLLLLMIRIEIVIENVHDHLFQLLGESQVPCWESNSNLYFSPVPASRLFSIGFLIFFHLPQGYGKI